MCSIQPAELDTTIKNALAAMQTDAKEDRRQRSRLIATIEKECDDFSITPKQLVAILHNRKTRVRKDHGAKQD